MEHRANLVGKDRVEWQRYNSVTVLEIWRMLGITARGAC